MEEADGDFKLDKDRDAVQFLLGRGPEKDDDLWYHHRWRFYPVLFYLSLFWGLFHPARGSPNPALSESFPVAFYSNPSLFEVSIPLSLCWGPLISIWVAPMGFIPSMAYLVLRRVTTAFAVIVPGGFSARDYGIVAVCSLLFVVCLWQPWNIYWSFTPISLKFYHPTSHGLLSTSFLRI